MNVIVILCDTLKRDHCSPYTDGKPLNEAWSEEAPAWRVPTPNMERLAERGTVFEQAYCGSSPCMPARRDIYTGRYEFLERGWGPLDEEDLDLPRQVSGKPNQSLHQMRANNDKISYLVTDHFHLWEQGSGNYHMGYSGFEFIRGAESDAMYTHPYDVPTLPEGDMFKKNERHWRNVHHIRKSEEDWFCAKVFDTAAKWLDNNHEQDGFYLHIDCFDPHEPWDPPEEYLADFMADAYDVEGWTAAPPYSKWRETLTEEQFESFRARYAAKVVLTDKWLGHFFDKLDQLNLWEDTLVIFTTDHGTYNGDHGRIGKLQTHQFDAVAHIPLIVAHPEFGHGERRSQLVQLVDIYPTVLDVLEKPIPDERHGISLLPILKDAETYSRDYAISGVFGKSISITDGEWVLHQSPKSDNKPLYWYGYHLAKFLPYDLGEYENGRRAVNCDSWDEITWLSDKRKDMNELVNLAEHEPQQVKQMQIALREMLEQCQAPSEQIDRLNL